ncbi:MAG: hypothetical protein RBS43_00325, partial [Candidatus Cloacimonas sp.]|nr:hypothetical protein [Candidatus Cloacimonas sp.]
MKSKVRSTLLFVVLFVIATTSMFAATRAFDDSHINVTIQNAGPGGVVVIGSTVKVTLTDPEYSSSLDPPNEILSAAVDFRLFGGIEADAMSWDPVLLKWKKDFVVQAGTINTITPTAKVKVRGFFRSGGESIIPDDALFIVNNIAGVLSLLPTDIITTVTPAGTAIVGSVIAVQFTSTTVTSASANFISFGGPVTPMVKTGDTFTASYTVVAGTIAGSFKVQIIGYNTGNPNPGVASDNDNTSINNVLPSSTDILGTHLEVNNTPALAMMKIGDTIHVKGTFKTTGSTIVSKVWINWGLTFTGGPITEYPVVAGVLNATYVPASGSLPANTANLLVKITKLQTVVGNFANGTWNVSGNGATPPVPIVADLMPPSILGVRDLWYDFAKPLRFSPVVTAVDGHATQPNDFAIFLTIPNWGAADGTKSFTLKFTSENRDEFMRTYSVGDAAVTSVGADLKVIWDGKNAANAIVADPLVTTYGITLWEIKDAVGNGATLTHIVGNEFSPTGVLDLTTHYNVQSGADNWVGNTILNRIHVVADNVPLGKNTDFAPVDYTVFTAANPIHLVRLIDDANNSNSWNSGEDVRYIDASGTTINTLNFNFQLLRAYSVDTNPKRHEEGKYWAVMESGTSKWLYNGATWVTYPVAFNQDTNSLNVPFVDQTALSNVMSLSWNTSSITDFPGAVTAGTPYKLYAYFQDNAGNIVKSQEVNVKIEHRYVHMPIISDINIISLHDGGTVGLPPLTAGIENFYMTSAYTPGGDHSGNYYVSTDIVSIEILINNRDNLTTADQAVSIQNTLGGTVPATIWLKKLDFVDNPNPLLPDRAVVNIQVANMNKISGALAPGKQWTVGGPVLPNNYMKVTAYPLATNPFITNFVATGSDKFNLVIPEEPVWPSTDLVDYALTATPDVFSPGNPINTYDAVTNPANDANTDETNFSFTIPLANRDVTWTLRLENLAGTLVKSWTGNLAAPELPYTSAPYNFTGLKDDLTLVTPALATEDLNLKLIVQPAPYGDTGYTAPPTTVVPSKVVTIDNINPTLATGAGSSFAANKVITLLPAQPTPVVTQTQRDIAFTLHTSEYLDATILNQLDPIDNLLKGTGWNIQVLDSLGVALMNGALPVTATINTIVPANGNKTFAITATLNNLAGDFTAKNAKLHIRLPWDKAKNPARYNNPSFPYNADVFSNDSAEGFLTLHILNAKPRINDITFTNKTITGTAGYAAGTWNTAITQAWVRDGGTTPPLGNFTMVATVTGGAYRAMNTSWTANLQPLLGGTGTANTAVVPVATSTVNPINESIVWTLTWTGNIPTTVASAWTHNQALTIPISIITSDGSNPAAHTETQSIVVRVDKAAPVASTTATEIVADGNAKAITFSVVDNPGSGVYWNTVVGNPYGYVGESLVLSPNTGMTVSDTGDGTFTIAIPATTTINKFTATYTAKDHMGNQVVYVRYLNVTPKPKVKDVKIVMTPPATLHVPGNAMLVRFNVENRTRVENLQITFTGTGVSVVGGSPLNGNPQTITLTPAEISGSAPIERSFNVVAADASTLTATITGTVTQYTDAATGATTPPTAINYGVGVDADNIDTIGVDTKPIIQAVSFYHNNQLIKSLWKDDYINNEYVNVDSIVIKVLSPSNLQNPVFKLGAVILPNYTSYIAPVNSNNTHYYKWVNPALNPSLTALSWSAAELAEFNKIADFTEDIATIHGYNATKWNHGMALLREPEKRVWGVTDPNGWFAPEHQVKAEYKFSSLVNTTVYNSGIIAAEFDAIEDNIVDNWKFPDQTGGLSRIAKTPTFLQGLTGAANNTTVNFWRYTTTWTITNPDVQSIWNNYADGQQVAVDFRHQAGPLAAVGIGNNTIYDTAKIKVDEKVPVYENQFNWATATGATAPATYYSETSMVLHKPFNQPEPVNNITVPLDANNKWANGKSIYVKYYAKDGSGVGLSSITTPTATGGWAVVQVSQNLTTGEKVIKISKSGELTNPQPFVVTFGAVQDSVGHFNYAAAGSTNSTDPEFRNLPPTLNISFAGDYAIGLTLIDPAIDAATRPIRAYQVFDTNNDTLFSVGELTDWRSAPYIKPGQKMGFMLKPDYPSGDRGSGVDVDNITVDAVFIDVSKVLNKTAVAANWQPLTKIVNPIDPLNKVWYLTNPQTLDIAYNNGEPIEFRYKINYRIPYLNPAIPDDIVPFEPTEPRNAEAFADKQSPVIQSVMVASESYFNNNHPDGYVVVDDENGTITIKFTGISVPGIRYTNLNTKPAINITGLNRFVSQKMGTPIIPVAAIGPNDWDLSYDIITNVWTGTLDSLKIIAPASAPFDGSQIAYTVTDVVGNAPHTGNRMVEIINSPIVPYIIRAEVVSSWDTPPAHSVSNYIVKAPGLTNELRVYINTAHQAYIEDMSVIGAHNGITFGAMTIAPYTDPLDSRIKFVAKRTLTLANNFYTLYSNGTAVNIEVKTIRHPYGADVFEHTAMINAVVDGDAFQAETPLIYGISVENPTQEIANIISTMRPMKVSVKLNDLSEAQALAMLTNPLSNLLVLSSIPAGLIDIALVAAPAVTVDVDGNHTAVWDIPAAAINDSLGITQAKVQVVYNNVYGISKTVTSDFFFIDNEVPIVNANGIQLLIGANTYSSNYNPAVAIAATDGWEDWENWTAVKVYLKDMPSVNMAGLYQATLKMQPQALTYQDSPAMQNLNMYSTSDIQNDANGSYLNLNLATALAPYTVYDLAVGFYNIKLTNLKDRFGNVIEYTQPLYFNPDSTSITLIPINASNQVTTSQQTVSLRALVNDPTGTVNGVQFRLYYDIDADGVFTPGTDPEYASDIIAGINGNPDMTPPFQAEWNLTDRNHYSWAQGTPYDTLAVRNFFVRVSAITGSRYVTDQVTMVQVTDNVPPVPVVQPYVANPNLTVHPNGAIDYDYNTISNNSITLKTNFVNWPDAYKAIFEISKVGSTDAPVVIESAAMLNPTDQVSVIWNYGNSVAGYDPTGTYKVDVKGLQYAENRVSISVPTHLADIVISNPANNVSYGLFIDDIITFNNEVRIGGNAVRGNLLDANKLWANPFTNLRLNASFNSLQGISKIRFHREKFNLVTGTVIETTNITTDQAWQADYVFDADGYIPADQIVANNAYVFLNESDYQTNNNEDIRYNFWVELIPTHAVSNDLFVGTASLTIDNRAPQVAITDLITPVSWFVKGQFKVEDADAPGYDIADIVNQNNIHLEWYNATDDAWYPAVFGTVVSPTITADYYTFKAWNIAGGSVNTFLGDNYAGAIQIRVVANDSWGNTFTSPVALPVVDNKAPVPPTRFTHVIHSYEGDSTVSYPTLTVIPDVTDAGLPMADSLNIVTSTPGTTGSNGSSNLQLFVDANSLGTVDTVMPLIMYHQTPDGVWSSAEFDHEAWNLGDVANPNLYEFVIPSTKLVAGTHRFVVVRKDAMGNLEGDIADNSALTYNVNGHLTPAEKDLAVDLIVYVTNIDDVIASIQYPADLAFIGGRKAITAIMTPADASVSAVQFQNKVGNDWVNMGIPVPTGTTHPVTFDLLRSDVPQYNALPWVPGVHLFNGGTELGELMWNGTSWTSTYDLTVGTAYSFQYGIDLNNNGIWETGEPLINDPKGFTNFTPTAWTLAFNSNDYAQGLHEFRAVPLKLNGDELAHYQSPSSWMIIDNVKPVINGITTVGNITNVTPGTGVPFVTDVTALLVATDDIVNVRYEYSGQPVGTVNRKWGVSDTYNTSNMSGNYPYNWTAVNPLTDNVDNNGNGLVDEAAEANGTFFVRAIASDRAGNFQISNEFAVHVDGSAAEMALFQIEDTNLAATNYIYQIDPSLATVWLSASELATGFDPAVSAKFFYKYIADIDNAWPGWTQIGTTVPVTNGVATTEFGSIHEGYYQFMVTAYDALGNNKSNVTTVIFNDVTGPEITFTAVGTIPVISEKYAFAQVTNDFNGSLTAVLSDITGVSAVTFEYSNSGLDGTWVNITTTNNIPASGMVTVNWTYPPLRAPLLYLKAIAQDANANNMQTEIVKLYHDTTAPSVDEALLTLTHTVVAGMKVIDIASDIEAMLTYTNLVDGTINDVNSVIVRLVNNNDGTFRQLSSPVYNDVNMAATSYIFTPVDLAGLANGTYRLEIQLTDFAGNASGIILPVAFQTLYNDTMAPANLAIASITYPSNVAVYNAEDITFRVNYTDLIGVAANGAMTATLTSMGVSDVVTAYTIDTVNNWIDFTWNPSAAMEQFIINGAMNIPVGIEVAVSDLLGQTATLTTPNNYFTLTYGIPNVARVMAVTDMVEGNRSLHYVNWNITPAQVVEMVGTNHTIGATPDPLKVYAYVPHMSEVPQSITMSYRVHGSLANPTLLGTAIQSNLFDPDYFLDPNFFAQFQQQYVLDWDISALNTGAYEIITTSNYISGNSSSSMLVNIYNGTIVPTVAVAGIAANGNVERGDTYTLGAASYTGSTEYLSSMVYQYRYVNPANGNSPTSQWMYFGDINGNPVSTWITDPYTFDWTVYPYYLHNNTVQIVGFAKDKWGTETPISSIISGGAYAIAHITDTTAPAVATINVNWNGLLNPAWLSGVIAPQATVMANVTTNINPNDLDHVEFYYNNVLIATETGYQANNTMNNLNTQAYPFTVSADVAVVSGVLKVMAYDVYGNVSTTELTINIDNTLPTANLAVTLNGTPITALERETTVLLNANAADAPAGVASVAYAYAYVEANPTWIAITPVEANGTANWLVPADLEYGHDYTIKATVTDLVGHVASSELTFEVSDINTEISIVSVVGHTPVNDIIPIRLHGDFPVVTNVPANQNIPRLAWYVRTALQGSVWNLLDPVLVTELFDYTTVLNLDTMPSGDYYLGVGPADRTAGTPVDQVMITLDNIININGITSIPATDGSFNGDSFVVNFTIASDDEIVGGILNQVKLSYAYP